MSKYLTVLTRRARKWSHLLGTKETVGRGMKVKRYIRKGIPASHRGKVGNLVLFETKICEMRK